MCANLMSLPLLQSREKIKIILLNFPFLIKKITELIKKFQRGQSASNSMEPLTYYASGNMLKLIFLIYFFVKKFTEEMKYGAITKLTEIV